MSCLIEESNKRDRAYIAKVNRLLEPLLAEALDQRDQLPAFLYALSAALGQAVALSAAGNLDAIRDGLHTVENTAQTNAMEQVKLMKKDPSRLLAMMMAYEAGRMRLQSKLDREKDCPCPKCSAARQQSGSSAGGPG